LNKPRPVGNTRHHVAAKNEIEWGLVGPRTLYIINFKLYVRGNPIYLVTTFGMWTLEVSHTRLVELG
jgi:hypothetical protein